MRAKRFRASWREPPNAAVEDYRGHNQIGEVVLSADYDSALAVLRGCVEAMEKLRRGHPYIDERLAAARKLLEGDGK